MVRHAIPAFAALLIVTEAGVHPNVSALVYVAARAPDAAFQSIASKAKGGAPSPS
jgi:hypothetical protein